MCEIDKDAAKKTVLRFPRYYVGMTGNPAQREGQLQTRGPRQPAWLKTGCLDFHFELLAQARLFVRMYFFFFEALVKSPYVQNRWNKHVACIVGLAGAL